MRTLVIGIDGGEWDVIEPLLDRGEMPNLSNLTNDGSHGNLTSTKPPLSPIAWTSIQTGANPGKHGIFDFSKITESYQRQSINSSHRKMIPFWQVMNDHDIQTGLFKIPFTYPPSDVDGFMVTGFPTPRTTNDYASPQSIVDSIGQPAQLFEDWSHQRTGDFSEFRDNLLDVVEHQTDVLLELLDEYDPEFLMTVYDGSDRIQHFYWDDYDNTHPQHDPSTEFADAIPEYYRAFDDAVGRLLSELSGDWNVMIISDHGFGSLRKDFYIDKWLSNNQYLSWYDSKSLRGLVSPGISKFARFTWQTANQLGLDDLVRKLLPQEWQSRGADLQNESKTATDWSETEAFLTTSAGRALCVNTIDRYERGIVAENEYDEVVSEIKSKLSGVVNPESGEEIVKGVQHKSELYHGWALESAPDLFIDTNPEYAVKHGRSSTLVSPATQFRQSKSGDHRLEGVIIASGPAFESGNISASVYDIAPTLLHLHGCPIPEEMDGSVLHSMLNMEMVGSEVTTTPDYGKDVRDRRDWTSDEEAEIKEQLNDMGYVG